MKTSQVFEKVTLSFCKFSNASKTLSKIFFASIIFGFSTKVYSEEDVASQAIKSDPMSGSYLLQLILGLAVVVLCIIVLAWLAKKMNRFQSLSDDSLKIIGGISMGSRERVVLLQVGEEQLLVGVSPGQINKLHVLDKPIETMAKNMEGSAGKGFSEKFKKMMADANTVATNKKHKQ